MPSATKTTNLGLNQWSGNEYPKRLDFLEDNAAIDGAVGKLANLTTDDKTNLVGAINEHETQINSLDVNKADLIDGKVPAEQLPEMNYLTPTGDSKDNKVTFTEAITDVDIATGDTHATLFGKILKNFNTLRESIYNIVNGGTTVGKAVTLNGLLSSIAELNFVKGVSSAIQTQLNGKAPTNHASTGTGYGLGTTANYGHVKTRNDLNATTYVDGEALSAYQGKVLSDKLYTTKPVLLATIPLNLTTAVDIKSYISNGYNPYDEYIFDLSGSITTQNTHPSQAQSLGIGLGSNPASGIDIDFVEMIVPPATTRTHTINVKSSAQAIYYRYDSYSHRKSYAFPGNSVNYLPAILSTLDTTTAYTQFKVYNPSTTYLQLSSNTLVLKIYGLNYTL